VIGAVGDLDRQRGFVKGLDIAADETAQQAAQAALGGIVPAERLELLLKCTEGAQTVVLLRKPRVQVVHVSLFELQKKLPVYTVRMGGWLGRAMLRFVEPVRLRQGFGGTAFAASPRRCGVWLAQP
jgi:hypothetical protein